MKNSKKQILIVVMVLCGVIKLNGMIDIQINRQVIQPSFLRGTIKELQNFASYMSQKTKERYAFVTDNALLGKLLIRLRVQSMKLGNRRDLSTFLKDENELINNTIKKIRFDYYKSQITKLLQLRSYVIHDVIEKTYINYMKIYNPNTLIAFKSMDKQSSGHFKKELEETKKIENVYTKYLNARQELQ